MSNLTPTDAAPTGFDFAFDFGTSPHGLSADAPLSNQETLGLDDVSTLSTELASGLHGEAIGKANHPSASQQAKRAGALGCACLGSTADSQQRRAAARAAGLHSLDLDECEFLHTFYAVEHGCKQIRRAIKKGLAIGQDLQATDSLWIKLEALMVARLMGRTA